MEISSILQQVGVLVIDGSMSTALEGRGCDLNDSLWSARVLAEQPELVRRVHLDYFRAGADCGITDSYQATIPGLIARGYGEKEAEQLIRLSVRLFRQARSQWWEEEGAHSGRIYPLCLGAVGPYGAYLADGSEYRGHYGVSEETLYTFHQRRMQLLWEEGADLLLIETQPSLAEALIEARIAEEMAADYWVSFTCKNESHTCAGDLLIDCARTLAKDHPHLRMIGINCTAPHLVEPLIAELKKGCDLPIAVYPNSGEHYDPRTKCWHGQSEERSFAGYAGIWMRAGAKAVGGCCRTVSSHIRQVVQARQDFLSNR